MQNEKGFSLSEVIVVLVILAVLAAFTMPTMLGYTMSSQEKLCNLTRMDMTRLYKTSLIGKESTVSSAGFEAFATENWGSVSQCPAGGSYTFQATLDADGKISAEIQCSKHGTIHVLTAVEALITKTGYYQGYLGFGPPSSHYLGTDKTLIIPTTLDGITIKGIYQDFFKNQGLTAVDFENNCELVRIHARAFQNNSLSSIDLPDSLTRIDLNAFENNQLTEIKLPNNLTTIEQNAFAGNNITKITIGNDVVLGDKVFGNNNDFREVYSQAGGGAGTYLYVEGEGWKKQE